MQDCPHNTLRKKRITDEHQYTFNAYVCGSCATIFEVTKHEEPRPVKEPMFPKNPIPWGLRDRQA
jgi:hypothetical protein